MTMKTIKLNVLKKNRVYFKCTTEYGRVVKLRITPASENLALGEHTLYVKDQTVESKYGIDYIYELEAEVAKDKFVLLQHPYNDRLVNSCRNLGGMWDGDAKVWAFPEFVEDKVEELDCLYNQDIVTVEITALDEIFRRHTSVKFLGYPIAVAYGRDSGAKVGDNVALVSGNILSGGSAKNWGSIVAEGAVFRLKVSRNLLATFDHDDSGIFSFKIIE